MLTNKIHVHGFLQIIIENKTSLLSFVQWIRFLTMLLDCRMDIPAKNTFTCE